MIHGLDTSFFVAVELASHSRHATSLASLEKMTNAGENVGVAPQSPHGVRSRH